MIVTDQDRARIAQAVAEAETRTAGEIVCVLADDSAEYRETPLVWATGAALVVPAAALLAGFSPDLAVRTVLGLIDPGAWSASIAAPQAQVPAALGLYVAVQAAVFMLSLGLVSIPAVRLALTPRSLKAERVRQAAMRQFLSLGMHVTEGRTGVLIYASLAEHRAEVIADEGIHGLAPDAPWETVASALTAGMRRRRPAEGFIAAVAAAADILAAHVPPRAEANPNELPDGLIRG